MSGYKHATDRTEAVGFVKCPEADGDNGHLLIELEAEGKNESVQDLLDTLRGMFAECEECGRDLEYLAQTTPKEVLD